MEKLSKIFHIIAIFVACFYFVSSESEILNQMFEKWEMEHNITYPDPEVFNTTFKRFIQVFKSVAKQNLKYYTYKSAFLMELNKYAGEIDPSFLNGGILNYSNHEDIPVLKDRAFNLPVYPDPPKSLDYRKLGLVTPVVDQGLNCSSCYAFAAICGVEAQVAKKYGRLNKLSEQQIVDCSVDYGNFGCKGGSIGNSLRYMKNNGIELDENYPYTANVGECKYDPSAIAEKIQSYVYVTGDENYLKSVLAAVGPLPVGIQGSLDSLYYFSKGIYDDKDCVGIIDHAVCLVGYDTDYSTDPPREYWIAKNSWSTSWAEDGYFKLLMGVNQCGIRNYVVYPVL